MEYKNHWRSIIRPILTSVQPRWAPRAWRQNPAQRVRRDWRLSLCACVWALNSRNPASLPWTTLRLVARSPETTSFSSALWSPHMKTLTDSGGLPLHLCPTCTQMQAQRRIPWTLLGQGLLTPRRLVSQPKSKAHLSRPTFFSSNSGSTSWLDRFPGLAWVVDYRARRFSINQINFRADSLSFGVVSSLNCLIGAEKDFGRQRNVKSGEFLWPLLTLRVLMRVTIFCVLFLHLNRMNDSFFQKPKAKQTESSCIHGEPQVLVHVLESVLLRYLRHVYVRKCIVVPHTWGMHMDSVILQSHAIAIATIHRTMLE